MSASRPAFARSGFETDTKNDSCYNTESQEGMTILEYYAGQAIAGLTNQAKIPDKEADEAAYCRKLARIARLAAQSLADEMADK